METTGASSLLPPPPPPYFEDAFIQAFEAALRRITTAAATQKGPSGLAAAAAGSSGDAAVRASAPAGLLTPDAAMTILDLTRVFLLCGSPNVAVPGLPQQQQQQAIGLSPLLTYVLARRRLHDTASNGGSNAAATPAWRMVTPQGGEVQSLAPTAVSAAEPAALHQRANGIPRLPVGRSLGLRLNSDLDHHLSTTALGRAKAHRVEGAPRVSLHEAVLETEICWDETPLNDSGNNTSHLIAFVRGFHEAAGRSPAATTAATTVADTSSTEIFKDTVGPAVLTICDGWGRHSGGGGGSKAPRILAEVPLSLCSIEWAQAGMKSTNAS